MAKMKVSIISPIRRSLPTLGCMSPVYNREFEEENLLPVVRAGFVVVDAADLTPIGIDSTDVNKIKKLTPKPAGGGGGGGSSQQGGGPKAQSQAPGSPPHQ